MNPAPPVTMILFCMRECVVRKPMNRHAIATPNMRAFFALAHKGGQVLRWHFVSSSKRKRKMIFSAPGRVAKESTLEACGISARLRKSTLPDLAVGQSGCLQCERWKLPVKQWREVFVPPHCRLNGCGKPNFPSAVPHP